MLFRLLKIKDTEKPVKRNILYIEKEINKKEITTIFFIRNKATSRKKNVVAPLNYWKKKEKLSISTFITRLIIFLTLKMFSNLKQVKDIIFIKLQNASH